MIGVIGICLIGCGGSEEFQPSATDTASSVTENQPEGDEGEEEPRTADEEDLDGFPPMTSFSLGCSVESPDCGGGMVCAALDAVGACSAIPGEETKLSDPYTQTVVVGQAPNFDCIGNYPDPSESSNVTIYGVVDRFGSGLVTEDIVVRVFEAATFDPWACDSLETAERAECLAALVNNQDLIIGETVSTGIEEEEGLECETDQDCPMGYACTGDGLTDECVVSFGLYELAGLPTNTPLVVMTRSLDEESGDWHDTYLFDTVFVEGYVEEGQRYRYDPLIVGHGQWKTVPSPFFTSIKPGNGAIGGRIRDCGTLGEDGRRAWNLYGATVGFANPADKTGYFNDKEADSLPDADRVSTNILGRYTGLDVPPGANVVSASLMAEGEVISLGAIPIYVFPSSLSVVSLPGRVATYTQN